MRNWARLAGGDFSDLTIDALGALEGAGWRHGYRLAGEASAPDQDREPVLVAYAPPARMNKFQALLYARAHAHGAAVAPLSEPGHVANIVWPGPLVLHLHWVGNLVRDAATRMEAEDRIGAFLSVLDAHRATGGLLAWTAHNTLPHDSRDPELDERLRRELTARCDGVHLMSEASGDILAERFGLDLARSFVAPHPTYHGAYPDFAAREQARLEVGVPPDARVVLFFGSIQRYKGLGLLRSAWEAVRDGADDADGPPARLLVAGQPTDAGLADELTAWAAGRLDAHVEAKKVPDDQVQYWFKSADCCVVPYTESLNSGVMMLALTFGVPVIAPAIGAFAGLAGRGVTTYDPEEGADGLAAALRAALRGDLAKVDNGALADRTPEAASDAFFGGLLGTLGLRGAR